jgi:flagellar export protein FliJ
VAFVFRLETVLRHRRREAEARATALAAAQRRLKTAADRLAAADRRLAAALASVETPTGAALHVGDLMAKTRWLHRLDADRAALAAEHRRCVAGRNACREALEAAWRRREILEHLKRRQEAEHREGARRRERVAMDEAGAVRHGGRGPA